MRVERLLGRVNGFCGCETNKKKQKQPVASILGVPIPPRHSIGLPTATPADSLLKSFKGSNLGFLLHLGLRSLQPACDKLRVYEPLDRFQLRVPYLARHRIARAG